MYVFLSNNKIQTANKEKSLCTIHTLEREEEADNRNKSNRKLFISESHEFQKIGGWAKWDKEGGIQFQPSFLMGFSWAQQLISSCLQKRSFAPPVFVPLLDTLVCAKWTMTRNILQEDRYQFGQMFEHDAHIIGLSTMAGSRAKET